MVPPFVGGTAYHNRDKLNYLQLWAKVAEDLRGNFSVRERVDMLGGLLRERALGLHSPVLALASQNRSAGNNGNGTGSAA